MKYNLHTHTERCNHAEDSDREYVEAAIAAGIEVLGFSDHCPQFFPVDDYYSFFRMKPGQLEDYVSSVLKLREEYKSDIKILLGLEAEYYPQTFRRFSDFIADFPLDYLILGEHFIGNEYDYDSFYEGKSDEELLKIYVNQVIEGLETGAFTYLAHPDNFYFRGRRSVYRSIMKKLCDYAREKEIPLEYNMLGYLNRRNYPNPHFWKLAAETGNKAVIGYDAHNPRALLNERAFSECQISLKKLGVRTVELGEMRLTP